jgi:release factor glutamine methyltransferase
MTANLTTSALLTDGAARLQSAGCETPALDAELLLAHALGSQRARLRSHPEHVPTDTARDRYAEMLGRRAVGEPLAYIVGYKDFWTLRLAVSRAVLVPRPETELLVERALALRPEMVARALDLGTGSGAIALTLASERPLWEVTATDLSADALSLARTNAANHGLTRVQFLGGSWFEPLGERRFSLVVSNPPYIGAAEPELASAALAHEPQIALSPGTDGMASLRAIVRAAPPHLEHGGWLLLEHGTTQAADVARELVVRGFRHVRSHRDLAGHERMTEAQWG